MTHEGVYIYYKITYKHIKKFTPLFVLVAYWIYFRYFRNYEWGVSFPYICF